MKRTLKGKILLGIVGVIVVVYVTINTMIGNVLEENLTNYITHDIETIKNIGYGEINKCYEQMRGESEADLKNRIFPILGTIHRTYNTYISLEKNLKDTLCFTGTMLDSTNKEKIVKESNQKASILYIKPIKQRLYATYCYPIYIDNEYKATLVLQKDYTVEATNYNKILYQIVGAQGIVYAIMIGLISLWLTKSMQALKALREDIRSAEKGNFKNTVQTAGKDEVSELAATFYQMRDELTNQMSALYKEKQHSEAIEKKQKEFFNYATHEMKTPLTGIKGYAQLIESQDMDTKTRHRMAKRITIEADRMYNLVQNMLVVAKGKEQLEEAYEYFDIVVLLEEIIQSNQVILETHKKVIALAVTNYRLLAIKEDIRTVLTNLISNAIKYSSTEAISIYSEEHNSYILYFENKIGNLPESIGENLLQPFVKYNYEDYSKVSSGLGLFICKTLIEKYKGSITYTIHQDTICFKIMFER
ncbi:MAG: histidine kinase dimerization/phospho-acceptor domain-containing protein [Cellulosilyticaceae bacterium]